MHPHSLGRKKRRFLRFGDVLPIERYGTQTPPWLGSLGAGRVSYAVLAIGDCRIMSWRER